MIPVLLAHLVDEVLDALFDASLLLVESDHAVEHTVDAFLRRRPDGAELELSPRDLRTLCAFPRRSLLHGHQRPPYFLFHSSARCSHASEQKPRK